MLGIDNSLELLDGDSDVSEGHLSVRHVVENAA